MPVYKILQNIRKLPNPFPYIFCQIDKSIGFQAAAFWNYPISHVTHDIILPFSLRNFHYKILTIDPSKLSKYSFQCSQNSYRRRPAPCRPAKCQIRTKALLPRITDGIRLHSGPIQNI